MNGQEEKNENTGVCPVFPFSESQSLSASRIVPQMLSVLLIKSREREYLSLGHKEHATCEEDGEYKYESMPLSAGIECRESI